MNETLDLDALAGAAGMGAVAGLRSMTAPALLSQAARTGSIELTSGPVAFLGTQHGADLVTILAAGELIMDKLPWTPNRTDLLPLAGRAVSGAVVGAAVCSARREEPLPGAIVGALAAVGATFLGFALRKALSAKVPGFLVALAEDAVAIAVAVAVLRKEAEARVVAD